MGYIKHDTILVTSWEDAERFAPHRGAGGGAK